jgi:hypothetical protein
MQVFIDVQVSKDLFHLGDGTPEQLLEAWEQLIEEYKTLTKDTANDYLFELRKSIEVIDKRLVILRTILDWLRDRPSEAVATLLSEEYGYTFEGDTERIWSMAKRELHQLRVKEAELTKLEASPQQDQTEFDWINNMGVLSEFQGFKFNPKVDTIAEYISLLNRFKIANTPKNGR